MVTEYPRLKSGIRSWLSTVFSLSLACCMECSTGPFPVIRYVPKESKDWQKKMLAEKKFIQARESEMEGNDHIALHYYEAAYELDPHSEVLRELLVGKYMRASRYNQALLFIKRKKKDGEYTDNDKRLLAGVYMRLGKLNDLSDILEKIKDKRAEEYYTLALMYESQGNIAKAIENYSGYLKKNPEPLQMWIKVGNLYSTLGQFGKAESLFIEMGHRFGQVPEVLTSIGLLKLFQGDTSAALSSFNKANLIDSTYDEALRNAAQIHIHRGEWAQAISCYEKMSKNGAFGDGYDRMLALLYFYNNQNPKALFFVNKLLAENIDDYELHYYYGLILASQDSTDLARMELEKTIALRPEFTDAWQQLCFLALKEKNYNLALSTAERFKNCLPHAAISWRTLGYILNLRKEFERALTVLKKSLALDSTDVMGWFEFGSSLERTKNTEKAAVAFQRVLLLKPGDPPTANYLGYMWADQGIKLDSARALLEMALCKDSLNGAYLDSYAWVCFKMGNIDTAFRYIIQALKVIKDDPVVYSHYGDILSKKGEAENALDAYKKSLELSPNKATPEEINDIINKIQILEKNAKRKLEKTTPR